MASPGHDDGIAGYELCPAIQMQAAEAGASFAMEESKALARSGDGWLVTTSADDYHARAVILATGTRLKKLGVPGEDALFGKGVSQCASCDAPLMRGKPVVVVGGGDSACQEALTLLPHVSGLSLITDGAALTALPVYADSLLADPKVELRFETTVEEIVGDTGVTAVTVRDASGARDRIDAHGVFVFVGLEEMDRSRLITGRWIKMAVSPPMIRGAWRCQDCWQPVRSVREQKAAPPRRRKTAKKRPPAPSLTCATAPGANRGANIMAEKLTVHDPRGYPPKVTGKRLAKRLDTLEEKTVYLVDCLFDNSELFMEQLRDWFAEHLPSVRTPMIKPYDSWVDDPDMRSEVAAKGDAAILGVGL